LLKSENTTAGRRVCTVDAGASRFYMKLNLGTPDEMPLKSSPLAAASSDGVHMESR